MNGVVKQRSNLSHHIWSVSETVRRADAMQDAGGDAHALRCRLGPTQIAHLSRLVALAPGDLLFMGTPAGVGPIRPGDKVRIEFERIGSMCMEVVQGSGGKASIFAPATA